MEGGSDGSPPQSLCMIRAAAELFPKTQMEKEDTQLTVPFQELAGESVKFLGRTDDGILALSNYRIYVQKNSHKSETSVPLGLVESAQCRELFHLIINCKDASTVKCSFETAEQCSEWQRRIQLSVGIPDTLESLFAFPFCSWTCDGMGNANFAQNGGHISDGSVGNGLENPPSSVSSTTDFSERLQRSTRYEHDFMREVVRLGFSLNVTWRISHANEDFKLCPSYPQKILVPCCISDEMLHRVANFRGSRRLPAVVWRHRKSGAVIARCSQPEVGWLGWRNDKDELLLKALADACAFDRSEQTRRLAQPSTGQEFPNDGSSPSSPEGSHEEVALVEVRKVLIVDARSYTSAVTNRARGGGCECIEYYPCAEIEFMNLGNIHVVRKSFHALRQLCASPPDVPNWLGLLEKTMWLQHLSGLLAASMTVCHAIEKKGRPVLVHCSDGWDRTPQIVATAQLCLDPYYRTVEGFRILVEREWLNYGHKFADRCGHGPGSDELNERCPVFLQWLDLVHQIHKQFSCCFEFNMGYLIKLAQHSLSCLFGTFLCNTLKERVDNSVYERTFSVWPFLSGPMYRNPLYIPQHDKVLWPAYNVRDLRLWTEVYLGSLGNQNSADCGSSNLDGLHGSISPMTKTRSYGDLLSAGIMQNGLSRRSSDPNMTVEPSLTIGSSSENNSVGDMQSEREDSPDIANQIHDTTQHIQNLTLELNNHDKQLGADSQQQLPEKPTSETDNSAVNYEATINNLMQQWHRNILTEDGAELSKASSESPYYSSPLKTFKEIGCEFNATSYDSSQIPLNSNLSSVLNEVVDSIAPEEHLQNGVGGVREGVYNEAKPLEHSASEQELNGISVHNPDNINVDLMQSVDLGDPSFNPAACFNNSDSQQNLWHGSINTSTDTLVPVEQRQRLNSGTSTNSQKMDDGQDMADGGYKRSNPLTTSEYDLFKGDRKSTYSSSLSNNTNSSSILPKVHSSSSLYRPSVLSTSPSAACLLKLSTNNDSNSTGTDSTPTNHPISNADNKDDSSVFQPTVFTTASTQVNPMEESILILPEHQKLEISISGKCETILSSANGITTTQGATASPTPAPTHTSYSYAPYATAPTASATAHRRIRTSSYNSRREALIARQCNGGNMSRFSLPGARSLPMTPPGLAERSQIAMSCPDGLAHALSEQNIRLQQIVHEHKIREDVLLRELHDMRMALLKKTCPTCSNAPAPNDEQADDLLASKRNRSKVAKQRRCQNHRNDFCDDDACDWENESAASSSLSTCSALENIESASICSWEAVEDRSGPSSCNSSSIQPNATSVLWVPDHAVSRCTSCQTEFWLGRRKHHCRSCGQIFCADCSEFWAPLPDEKLFSPVRLCGPCYHSVTTRMQVSQLQKDGLQSVIKAAAAAAPNHTVAPSVPLEACNHAAHAGSHHHQSQCAPGINATTAASN